MKKFKTIKDKNGILINKILGEVKVEDIFAHLIN